MIRHFGAVLIAALTLAAEEPAKAGVPEALAAMKKGQYAVAYKELIPLAEAGDPQAQLQLSILYHQGLGVAPDAAIALMWLDLALPKLNGAQKAQAEERRADLMEEMTADQIAEADRLLKARARK